MMGPARVKLARTQRRRGTGLAAVLLLVAVIGLAGLAVLASAPADSQIAAMRVETARALYASDSGAVAVIKLRMESKALPTQGTTLALPSATATYAVVPAGGTGSQRLVVIGVSGDGQRRIELNFTVN
jgi:Tfp pilus assembly protein PilX